MKRLPILILLIVFTRLVMAQNAKEEADKYFNNQEWKAAADAYQKYLKKNPQDSSALYNSGYSFLQLKDYKQAIGYFEKAEEQQFPVTFTTISIAKAYIGIDDTGSAIKQLTAGAKKGANAYMRLVKDSTFNVLRDKKGFAEAVELTKLNAYPCLKDENRKHFYFWVGDWDVFVKGNKVGENSITLANGGCAIHESYTTGMRNYTGQSMNYYDPQDEKWHQIWVGSAGGVLDYVEIDKAEGMLQFQCDFLTPKGQFSYSRLTFTANDDGTVRQFFENSTDGENWTPGFDGLYKKKTSD